MKKNKTSILTLFITFFLLSTSQVLSEKDSSSLNSLGPQNTISGMFSPDKEMLTCSVILGQNIAYPSGKAAQACENAHNLCMMTTALKNKINRSKTPNFILPKGLTIDSLKKDLIFANQLTEVYLRGCQLVLSEDQTGFNGILSPLPSSNSSFNP